MSSIRIWLEGQEPRKSNQRRIFTNRRTGKPFLAKSEEAVAWVDSVLASIPNHAKISMGGKNSPVAITFFCFYSDRRPDLSVELALDALEKAGIISNDRYVYEFHAYKLFSNRVQGVYAIISYQETPSRFTLESWAREDDQLAALVDKAFSLKIRGIT